MALSWALGYLLIDWALIPALLTASLRDGHAVISAGLQQDNMSGLHSKATANSNLGALEKPREILYSVLDWKYSAMLSW